MNRPKKNTSEQFFYNVDGKWKAFDCEQLDMGNSYTYTEFCVIRDTKTDSELKEIEYNWAYAEILTIDEEISKCLDGSSRAIATESEWRAYREELREYATVSDGVYSLRTDKPVRPTS